MSLTFTDIYISVYLVTDEVTHPASQITYIHSMDTLLSSKILLTLLGNSNKQLQQFYKCHRQNVHTLPSFSCLYKLCILQNILSVKKMARFTIRCLFKCIQKQRKGWQQIQCALSESRGRGPDECAERLRRCMSGRETAGEGGESRARLIHSGSDGHIQRGELMADALQPSIQTSHSNFPSLLPLRTIPERTENQRHMLETDHQIHRVLCVWMDT